MKKWIFSLLTVALLCALFVLPVQASQLLNPNLPDGRLRPRLVDEANLLRRAEAEELLETLDEISERQRCDVIVVTVNSLDGKRPRDFADDFYDYNGYGYGTAHDGILLLLSMEARDWWMTTTGYGTTAFTDAGLDYMSDQFLPKLKDNNYAKAFTIFAELCDDFITQAKTGKPYDTGNLPHAPMSVLWIFVSLAAGILLAFIPVTIMKGKLKSVRSQPAANSYIVQNSMNLTNQRDLFLYANTTRTARPKESKSGGSSTHRSSSGRSHGGRGGKF